jgi:diketogulonate reductase-like aldo/keto reductase
MSYEAAKKVIDDTMAAVGSKLDGYVDLCLLHCPYGGREARLGAWRALVEAVEAGKIRSIGVSNYGVHHLQELEDHIKEVDAREGEGKGGVLSVNQVCRTPQ